MLSFAPLPGEVFLTGPAAGDPLTIALDYLSRSGESVGFSARDVGRLIVTDRYTSAQGGATHIYLRQEFNGLEVTESDINVNVASDGSIISVGGRFSPAISALEETGEPAPLLTQAEAVAAAAAALGYEATGEIKVTADMGGPWRRATIDAPGISIDPVPAYLQYIADDAGNPVLAWEVVIRPADPAYWFEMSIDAGTGQVLRAANWVSNALYNVFAYPKADPGDGPRTIETDPWMRALNASPFGWQDTDGVSGAEFTDTQGNNVQAQEDINGDDANGVRPDGGADLVFDFPYDPAQAPSTYTAAATTNLFYYNNIIHDITYQYGFDEVGGNFQRNTYGRGGAGEDPVVADAQDGSGTNNAFFGTPPDGQSGQMTMFVWTFTTPARDSDMTNDVIAHEYGHGISNRLTGGPSNAAALQAIQSRSMGEGWSDFLALMLGQKASDGPNDAYAIAPYLLPGGLRSFPYSFDLNVSPRTFSTTVAANGPHFNGEVWASALWDMNWLLRERLGFDADLYTGVDFANPEANAGNKIALQLYLYGMKLQPVNPSFLQARDAILQADQVLFGGEFAPQIWQAFARRGMGFSARDVSGSGEFNIVEAFDVPNFIDIDFESLPGLRENQPLSNVVVARLDDRAGLGSPEDYRVTVDWGDGGGEEVATLVPSVRGGYDIVSSYTFQEGGNYTVTIVADRVGSLPTRQEATLQVISEPIFAIPGDDIVSQENVVVPNRLVASFNDFDPQVNPAFYYTATINWGDNAVSQGTIVPNAQGGFDVFGEHAYIEGGRFVYRVTITEAGGNSTSASGSANVSSFPVDASGGFAYAVLEGTTFFGRVATFRDLDPGFNSEANYTAQIEWGDGTITPGVIVSDGAGGYNVNGQNEFGLGPDGQTDLTIKVTVRERGGNSDTATSEVRVADAPIIAESVDIRAVEGNFSGVVARVIDTNPGGDPAELRATIFWGDGSSSQGSVRAGEGGFFEVLGDHLYSFGFYPVRVEVASIGGSTSSTTSNAIVADAPITPRGLPIIGVEGPFAGRVATFVDQNPAGQASEYSATVDWGDGTTSPATIVADGDATFSVISSHAFRVGAFPITVSIASAGGGRFSTRNTATISDAPIVGAPVPVQFVENARSTVAVGAVFDSNPVGTAGELSATINWGDGTTSAGSLIPGPGGGFVLLGDHLYVQSGNYPIVATVTSVGGSTTQINTTATVEVNVFTVRGGLEPASDNGASTSDGVTSDRSPTFTGTAAPGSTVRLTAQGPLGANVVIGTTTADPATGDWSLTATGLADGAYQVVASATNTAGRPNSPSIVLNPGAPVVVDTTGPFVRDAFLDARRGQLRILFGDAGAGLSPESLGSAANFGLSNLNGAPIAVTRVELMAPNADGSQTAVVTLANGRALRRGGYVITVNGNGISDRAGNGLRETFYTPFPQLPNQLSPLYLAQIGTNGTSSTAPLQFVPPAQLRGAALFRRFVAAGFRRRPIQ